MTSTYVWDINIYIDGELVEKRQEQKSKRIWYTNYFKYILKVCTYFNMFKIFEYFDKYIRF